MRSIVIASALLAMLSSGCETMSSSETPRAVPAAMSDPSGRMMVRTELMFGLTKDDGTPIDEFAWDKFVEDSIAVWFPTGVTVEDAKGCWRGRDGKIVTERSKVLILIHDGSDQNVRKLDEVRPAFTRKRLWKKNRSSVRAARFGLRSWNCGNFFASARSILT